jgi:hypothetical protein
MDPGIYEIGGTLHGERCLAAYDGEGEFTIRTGPDAYGQLEDWLRDRGVVVASRAALFIVRSAGGLLAYWNTLSYLA